VRTWPALTLGGAAFGEPETVEFIQAALTEFEVSALEELTPLSWRVFFATPPVRDAAASALQRDFPTITIESIDVPDDDWAARSQANLRAIAVGALIVAPPWDVRQDRTTIVIQPSMGFGTGHHATTRLCLAALQRLDLQGRSVIDVGTGSGVLALAASVLGAAPVTGIDDDADAIQAAQENLALNPKARATFAVVDLRLTAYPPADVVLANLTGGLLCSAASRLERLTAAGGRMILSGFMDDEAEDVLRAFASADVEHRAQEDEWVSVTLRTRP
jgi:ribosomal protein L11 methyltransferase